MQNKISQILELVFYLYVCINLSGCTGLYYLATKDMEKEQEAKSKIKAEDIPIGSDIRIELVGDSQIDGIFVGIVDFPADEYLKRYVGCLEKVADIQPFPMPGDSVTVIKYLEKEYAGLFQGFDHGNPGKICISKFPDMTQSKLRMEDVKEVRFVGNSITGTDLRNILSTEKIAQLSAVMIESGGVHRHFGMAEIEQISLRKGELLEGMVLWYAVSADIAFLGLMTGLIVPKISFK